MDERTRYTHAYRTFLYHADRTKHILAQRSFLFSAGRLKTLANRKLAKRLVGETSGHQTNPLFQKRFFLGLLPCPVFRVQPQPRSQGFSYTFLRSERERRVGERTWERGWFNPGNSHLRRPGSGQSDRLPFSLRTLLEESFPARARQERRTVEVVGKLRGIRRSRKQHDRCWPPIVPIEKRAFE